MDNIIVHIENWRFVDEQPNYEVSSHGRVRNVKTMKVLKAHIGKTGYFTVNLSSNGKGKTIKVHRLVAFAYCINLNDYNICDHIDRNKLNNMFNNLRWCTSQDNSRNISKPITNKSGTKGVCYDKERDSWNATWVTLEGKRKNKRFHGVNAKQQAIEHRMKMEELYYKIL